VLLSDDFDSFFDDFEESESDESLLLEELPFDGFLAGLEPEP
jgi:hypothetical protein